MFNHRMTLFSITAAVLLTTSLSQAQGGLIHGHGIDTPTFTSPRETIVRLEQQSPQLSEPQQAILPPEVEIVVDFDDHTSASQVQEVEGITGIHFSPNSILVTQDRMYRAIIPRNQLETVINQLYHQENRGVRAVEENRIMNAYFTPNDPRFEEQWGLNRVGVQSAWNTTCGAGVVVAVIDTGVACSNHNQFHQLSDLAGTHCVPGYDFVDDDTHPDDEQGHGSHVAGTIAQTTNNGVGVAGIAYCSSIMPVRVLNENGSGTLADVAEGIIWASDHGAQVINLSLGGGGHSKVMADAIAHARNQGTVVVCAAGNNGRYVESPASEPGAFAVSAVDSNDNIASFSSRGPEVDIAAPGVGILQQTICDHGRNRCEQFVAWSGTSMATPHVAGVAALVFSMGISGPDNVERILMESSVGPQNSSDFDHNLFGSGIVNAASVIHAIQWNKVFYRGGALTVLAMALFYFIRSAKGKVVNVQTWLPAALVSSVGLLFFIPFLMPFSFPGMFLLTSPMGDWTIPLGTSIHQWLFLGNAGVILLLVGLVSGMKQVRPYLGGLSLGMAAYILGSYMLGININPLSSILGNSLNYLVMIPSVAFCLWTARINLDLNTINPPTSPVNTSSSI